MTDEEIGKLTLRLVISASMLILLMMSVVCIIRINRLEKKVNHAEAVVRRLEAVVDSYIGNHSILKE